MHRRIIAKLTLSIFAIILVLLGVCIQSHAKELNNRLGVGFSDQFSEPMPSLALRYYPEPYLGVGAALGVDTEEDQSKFGFMVRLYRILYVEDHMNFYMGTSAGIISLEENNDSDSGFELSGYAGAEFFFSELQNLGFSFEVGVGVTSISSEVRFRTIGDHPWKAGITFYLDDAGS